MLFAVAYFAVGVGGVVLFVLPLLVARYTFKLYTDTRKDLEDFAGALASIIDEWDPYTHKHSERVSRLAATLAREMGLPEREVEVVRMGGLLHDIGKITASQFDLVTKPARLTPEERTRMCDHADLGADILDRVRAFRRIVPVVRYHHERPDGKGYHRLPGSLVPLGSRIVLVADAFDAMTTDRVYRKAMSVDAALAELRRYAATQFDAAVVETLVRLADKGLVGEAAAPRLAEAVPSSPLASTGAAV
jgi:putative nucleotidyltransferase with HDIG domain